MPKLRVPVFMTSTTFWVIVWILAFLLGVFIRDQYINPANDPQVITEHEAQVTKWKTKYKTLRRQKRVLIPVPSYRPSECESAVETCEGSLAAIRLWCDPYCKQQLTDCLESLQRLGELTRECQSWAL